MTSPAPISTQPATFKIRAFRDEDYGPVADLLIRHDLEAFGSSNTSEHFLREDWQLVNFDAALDTAVAERPDGTLAGVITCYTIRPVPVRPFLFGYAVPENREVIADALLDWATARSQDVFTRVPENARVVIEANIHNSQTAWVDALKKRGYACEHVSYTMLIKFDDQPIPAPVFPDGFRMVSFAENPDLELFARTLRASFADHRGFTADQPISFDIERYAIETAKPDFDPTAWWLLMDGDTPAAICTTYDESDEFPNVAYIHQLGTVPAYRKRGLALGVLHFAFTEFKKRGKDGVSLGVDGSSLTNAVALYQRAGMHVAIQWDKYELEIRPGVELTKQ